MFLSMHHISSGSWVSGAMDLESTYLLARQEKIIGFRFLQWIFVKNVQLFAKKGNNFSTLSTVSLFLSRRDEYNLSHSQEIALRRKS